MTESLKAAGWNEGENPILPNGKLQICRARLVVFSLKNQMAQLKLIDYHSLKKNWLTCDHWSSSICVEFRVLFCMMKDTKGQEWEESGPKIV